MSDEPEHCVICFDQFESNSPSSVKSQYHILAPDGTTCNKLYCLQCIIGCFKESPVKKRRPRCPTCKGRFCYAWPIDPGNVYQFRVTGPLNQIREIRKMGGLVNGYTSDFITGIETQEGTRKLCTLFEVSPLDDGWVSPDAFPPTLSCKEPLPIRHVFLQNAPLSALNSRVPGSDNNEKESIDQPNLNELAKEPEASVEELERRAESSDAEEEIGLLADLTDVTTNNQTSINRTASFLEGTQPITLPEIQQSFAGANSTITNSRSSPVDTPATTASLSVRRVRNRTTQINGVQKAQNTANRECPRCGKWLSRTGLIRHINGTHGRYNSSNTCTICFSPFTQRSSLLRHMKKFHPINSNSMS